MDIRDLAPVTGTLDATDRVIVYEGSGGDVTTSINVPHPATLSVLAAALANIGSVVQKSAAAWASLNPVVPLGVLAFETDTGVIRVGNGTSNYLSLSSGQRTAKQTGAPQTNSSNVSFVDIGGLVLPVQSGHLYEFYAQLTCQTDLATAGPTFAVTGPALTTGRWTSEIQLNATGTTQMANQSNGFGTTNGYSSGTFSVGAGADFSVVLYGKFQPSADGTVQLKFRSSTNGQVMTVVAGGYMRLLDIA